MGSLLDAALGILDGLPLGVLGVFLVVIAVVLWVGYRFLARYTGFGEHEVKVTETFEYQNGNEVKTQIARERQTSRTFWDWMTVLTISAVIGLIGFLYTISQQQQQRDIQDQQAKDAALQAYLDQMSALLLDKDRPLGESKQDDAVQTLARMRTVTALRMLDAEQNESVTTFLKESDLVNFRLPSDKTETVLRLDHADL
jgi:type II secretory pathway pseudopilin PulG